MRTRFGLLAAILLLSGCFDLKQDFTFTADGNAKMTARLAMDAALVALAQNEDGPFNCDQMPANFKAEGLDASVESASDGGDIICTVSVSGPAEKLFVALNKTDQANGAPDYAFSKNPDGTFTLAFAMSGPQKDRSKDSMEQALEAMFVAKLSGRSVGWSVTAPKIIETTGTVSEDGRTASYSRPLAEVFTADAPTSFSVTFSTVEPGIMGWIGSWFR